MDLSPKLASCVDSLMSNRCTHVGEAAVEFLCQLLNMKKKSTQMLSIVCNWLAGSKVTETHVGGW